MFRKILILILFFVVQILNSRASHIVGGEITYKCLGNNQYEITINIYRDCLPPNQGGGSPLALADDNPAFVTIYRGNSFFSFDSIQATSSFTVPVNFSNDCINNPPATCINRLQFKFIKTLPLSNQAYTILYQRCCRNETISNVLNPGTTGASFTTKIPPNICNTSPTFTNYPPQIICVNNPFIYDHSATDTDGDSLSYEFCNAFIGGSETNPKPIISFPNLPNLNSVNYSSPFTALNPMGGNPPLQINPTTGLVTGTPNIQGRFVVTVCCNEWRGGQIINTIRRDFQFVVTNCSKAVVANIPQFSEEPNTYVVSCKTRTVNFKNLSTGGFKYHWDFGVPGLDSDTSNLFEPTFTYPDTGRYVVKLIVNKGSTCPDSIDRIVKVYPDYKADFGYNGLLCPDNPISFTDNSTTTYPIINYWNWNFGDGTSSNLQNPTHSFQNVTNTYNVVLISGTSLGCRDTISKTLEIPAVKVFAGNDTVIVQDNFIRFNASGAVNYTWSPPTYLDNTLVGNPLGYFPDTGRYTYYLVGVTANGCIGYDTMQVIVANAPYLVLPNAFTPNSDGLNDVFKILAAGYKRVNRFRIYNRWGEMVFSTTNISKGWDGTYKGRDCEIGTYFWFIDATDKDDKAKQIKGDVNLIR